jgi:hypothetical protein
VKKAVRTSIYAKIFSIAIGLILLMVVVALASSYLVSRVGEELRTQGEVLIPVNNLIAGLEVKILEQVIQLEHLFRLRATPEIADTGVEETTARLAALSEEIRQRFEGAHAVLDAHEPAWFDDEARVETARIAALLQGIEREYNDYFGHSQTMIELAQDGRAEEMALVDRLLAHEEVEIYEALDSLRGETRPVRRGRPARERPARGLARHPDRESDRRRDPARAARGRDRHPQPGRADQAADHGRPGRAGGRSGVRSRGHVAR